MCECVTSMECTPRYPDTVCFNTTTNSRRSVALVLLLQNRSSTTSVCTSCQRLTQILAELNL